MEKRQFIAAILSLWMALVALSQTGYAQTPPSLTWQKALGGLSSDIAYAVTASSDGGYVVAGETYSTDGDVTEGYHGSGDYWVVKLDGAGNKVWQKVLGGSQYEVAYAITTSPDGGYVVAGYTLSNDGDVSGNHNQADFWVVKLDGAGNKVWQKALGGTGYEVATAITASGDGGYVVAGYTNSNDGDVTGTQGKVDYWVVKLDGAGNKVWQKALGGSDSDVAYAITPSGDGGFVVAGETSSYDGDVSGQHGGTDYWVVKLDGAGNKVWQKALGGSNSDVARAITASPDGGFVVAGTTFTFNTDGDVSGNHGMYDYWVVKLDGAGNKVWQKALGGSDSDFATAITASPDGGFVVAGYTESNDGDVTDKHGWPDYWIVKLDEAGNKVWQKALGGSGSDYATAITPSADKGFVVAGYTYSTDGDVTGAHGNADYWVVKLNTTSPTLSGLSASPNPVCAGHSVQFTATVGDVNGSYTYTLDNGAGSSLSGTASGTAFSQNLTAAGSGSQTYTLTVTAANGTASDDVTITVNPLPTPSITGLATAYCRDASALTLTATPSGGSFTIDGNSANQLDPASLTAGSHTVRYTLTVNGCTAFTEQSVEIKALPTPAITGLSAAYCKDAAAVTLTATPSGGSFIIDNQPATQLDPASLTVGPHTVRYTVTVNGCTAFTEQSVEIRALPTPAITGLNAAYCKDAAAVTLTATPSGGQFTIDGNSASQLNPVSLTAGSHTVRYTLTANGCTAFTEQSVEIKALPTPAITGLSAAYCKDATAVTLTATPSGGQFTIDGNSASQLNPVSLTAGSHTVRYTLTANGCTAFTEQSVEIKALPTPAITGLANSYCADASALTLTATPSGGSFTIDNQPATQLDPASLTVGPHTVRYTVTVNGCTAFTEQSVEIRALPTPAITGLNAAYCKDAAAVTLTATPSGGQFTIDGNSASQLNPVSLTAGSHTVRYTLTANGCTAFTEQSVEIRALSTPAITVLANSYCKDAGAITLTATPSGGSFTIDGNSASQLDPASLSVGSHTVRYTLTANGCTAFAEQSVEIKALPMPVITGLANSYCADASALTLTATPSGGQFTIDGNSASQLDPASLSVGSHTVRYTVTVNGCTAFTEQSVEIRALPTPAITGLTNAYCKDAAAVTLTATPSGGQFTIDGNSASQLNPASLSVGSHTVRYTLTANGCTAFTEQSVIIKALPDASFTGLAGPYCADAAPVTLTPTTPEGTFTGPGVSGSTFTPANAGSSGTILYTVTVDGCSNTSQQSVTVRPAITLNTSPNTSVVYGYGSNCTTLTASATGGTGALGLSWSTGASGSSVQVCPTQTTAYTATATDAAGCSVSRQITVAVNDVRCGSGGVKMCLGGRESCVAPYLVPTYLRFGGTLGGCANGAARMSYEPPGSLELSLEAYPNPAQDAVTVRVLSPTAGQGTLTVLDMNGMTRQTRTEQLSEGLNEVELRLGGLPSGTYLIRCLDAYNRQGVVRISKQ